MARLPSASSAGPRAEGIAGKGKARIGPKC